jgi:hypothetical protein
MVKLYGHSSRLAVLSSRSNGGLREPGVSLRPPVRCLRPLALRRGRLHKQTQLPAAGISQYSTTLSFHHSNPCLSCKTKPISGTRPGGRGTRGNRVKRTQFPAGRGLGGVDRGQLYKQDAPDKSQDRPARASISAQKRGSKPDLRTFVVSVKQTQFGAPGREEGCHCEQTKPIGQVAYRAKQSQSAAGGSTMGTGRQGRPCRRGVRTCKTNPNPSGAGWDEAPGTWGAGQSCETKPIWEGVGRGRPTHSLSLRAGSAKSRSCEKKPNLGRLGHVGKGDHPKGAALPEGGTCETNRICWSRCERQVLLKERVMAISGGLSTVKNKANSRRMGRGPGDGGRGMLYEQSQLARTYRAKRTQFPGAAEGLPSPLDPPASPPPSPPCETKPIPGGHPTMRSRTPSGGQGISC